jgi:hypothetical protein
MIATSSRRVADQTRHDVNEQIRQRSEQSVAYFAAHPDQIDQRLDELDREWDIERALETMASSISLFGLSRSLLTGRRRWLLLPAVVQSFLLQHALQGWCPPLPMLRRLGFRTAEEIGRERYALKALRGDFERVTPGPMAAVMPAQAAEDAFGASGAD